MFNEEANKAYIETQFKIDEQIKELQNKLADHNQAAMNINWAHVGDMKYILSQVRQLNDNG
jgi:hypothetical protein